MRKALSKIFNPSVVRALKILAMGDMVAAVFLEGISLPNKNTFYNLVVSDAHAASTGTSVTAIVDAPELPVVMIPLFITLTCVALYYIRRNMLRVSHA